MVRVWARIERGCRRGSHKLVEEEARLIGKKDLLFPILP